jgi:hypothetical protein
MACLERQQVAESVITPGDAVFVRTGHGTRWFTETATFYDGAPGIGLECARWFADKQVCVVGADNFAVEVVPPVDPEVFHPCHQHLIMKHGIHLHEGMSFEGWSSAACSSSPMSSRRCRSSAPPARRAIRSPFSSPLRRPPARRRARRRASPGG